MPLGVLPFLGGAGGAAAGAKTLGSGLFGRFLSSSLGKTIGSSLLGGLGTGLSKRIDAQVAGDKGNYYGQPGGYLQHQGQQYSREQQGAYAQMAEAERSFQSELLSKEQGFTLHRDALLHQYDLERMEEQDRLYTQRAAGESLHRIGGNRPPLKTPYGSVPPGTLPFLPWLFSNDGPFGASFVQDWLYGKKGASFNPDHANLTFSPGPNARARSRGFYQ